MNLKDIQTIVKYEIRVGDGSTWLVLCAPSRPILLTPSKGDTAQYHQAEGDVAHILQSTPHYSLKDEQVSQIIKKNIDYLELCSSLLTLLPYSVDRGVLRNEFERIPIKHITSLLAVDDRYFIATKTMEKEIKMSVTSFSELKSEMNLR